MPIRPKYKQQFASCEQELYAERRDHLATKRMLELFQLTCVGFAVFSLLCLAFALRVIL